MRIKYIFLGVLGVLIVATVVLQMTSMGNYEEMVETEYDEFQVRIDFKQMGQERLSLFQGKTHLLIVKTEPESAEDKAPEGEKDAPDTVPTLREAPRVPTLNTLPPMTEGRQ